MNTIDIFIKRLSEHWILTLFAGISLWGSIHTSIPSLYLPSIFDEQTAHGITVIIQGISFSFFAAWLFYIFQTVIPYIQNFKETHISYNNTIILIKDALCAIESHIFMPEKVPSHYSSSDMLEHTKSEFLFNAEQKKCLVDKWGIQIDESKSNDINISLSFVLICIQYARIIVNGIDNIPNKELLTKSETMRLEDIKENPFIKYFSDKTNYTNLYKNDKNWLDSLYKEFINMKTRIDNESN